ncbi:MAG: DUF4132 domain-containing protein [Lachnospiraceae bacterium]|nr:DUF4132 domain-containing protein [Lachnospiraceae bacterium]
MLRAQNGQVDKVREALADLGLTDGELELAEKYLKGETGEETLAEVEIRDMSGIPREKALPVAKLLGSFMKKKQHDETLRLFNLLYALGSHTCFQCLGQEYQIFWEFIRNVEAKNLRIDPYKIVAVYARHTYRSCLSWCNHYPYFMSEHMYSALKKHAGGLPETVRRALREYESGYIGERLILLTVLFNMNYDSVQSAEAFRKKSTQSADEGGVLGGIRKLLGGKNPSEDAAWMGEYEKLLKEAMCQAVLPGIPGRVMDRPLFMLAGGCAFVNYMLSEKLYHVVKTCCAADPKLMLSVFCALDPRGEISRSGGDWDDLFGIPSRELLAWVAEQMKNDNRSSVTGLKEEDGKKILRVQLRKHPAAFLECYHNAEFAAAAKMAQIMKEEDPALYQREVLAKGDEQKEKVIALFNFQSSFPQECRDYLEGRVDIQALYAVRNRLSIPYHGSTYGCRNALEQYVQTYHDEDFYGRCMAIMAVLEYGYFFTAFSAKPAQKEAFELELRHIFSGLTLAGMGVAQQLRVITLMTDTIYDTVKKQAVTDGGISIFQQYLAQRTQETVTAFSEAGAYGRYFALLVYGSKANLQVTDENRESCQAALAEFAKGKDAWQEQILSYSQDSSKLVKEELERILADRPGWREQVKGLLSSKKAAEREMGIRVLAKWNTPQDRETLQELYEKEKNAKIRTLLDTVLGHEAAAGDAGEGGAGEGSPALTREDLVKNLHKGGKKRSLAWAYETPFSPVRRKGGEQATEEYLQALLLCYCSMAKPGISTDAALLAQDLEPQELAVYVGELFDKWMSAGAEAKKRWVLYVASIHGGTDIIQRLYHQIQEWPQNARGAIAADAVQALALNPQPQALLIVDGIARKFKFKQVKAAAGQALEFAASQLGLTREQLEDKIVPSLGFDENMERRFDYGSRSFTVTITPALEVEVFDENGKKLKNMPAPGAKDDAEKAAAAYAEFKEMKKQMKATVTSQKQRLELALSSERLWSVEAWRELFVGNPIMHQFAIGLVWGIYEDHKLAQSFRYMEDGSFNTEDEDEYTLPEQGQIGLVHPIELTKESLETWKQQLEDYEITQPIEQLGRTIYYITPEEQKAKSLERFGGMILNDLSLGGKLTTLGWYRGSVQDAGGFDTYYREDASIGLGAELHFSGSYVGSGSMGGEDVTVYDVRFYKAGTIERGSYCYDEAKGEKQLPLKDIPQRYFSEIIWQLAKATASSKERDEDWKTEMG